jgi:alkylation response protein AidB-like acyl-CoA dehydrogenase
MKTTIEQRLASVRQKAAVFAAREIACRDELYKQDEFPLDIWSRMGQAELLGMGVSKKYGGTMGNSVDIVAAGEALVRYGHNMGIALSWVVHLLVAGFLIGRFGSRAQRSKYLQDLATGLITASIAVSEAGVGSHPRFLRASGHQKNGSFDLNGEKTCLTNGPMADLFVVFVVTRVTEGGNRFTAFLVPRGTRGLSIIEPLHLDFLKPSAHCGIRLSKCRIPAENVLGREELAFKEMARPFRKLEEVLLMGPVLGAMERQMEIILGEIRDAGISPDDALKERLGEIMTLQETLKCLTYETAKRADRSIHENGLDALLVSLRSITERHQFLVDHLTVALGVGKEGELSALVKDVCQTVKIGKFADFARKKKMGASLLAGRDSCE